MDDRGLCGARTSSGTCKQMAGAGTENDSGPCYLHGGRLPQAEKGATKRAVVEKATLHAAVADNVNPTDAIQELVNLSYSTVHAWKQLVEELGPHQLAELTGTGQTVASFKVRMYEESLDRLLRASVAANNASLTERQVRVTEEQGKQLAMVIRALLADPELGLTESQQTLAPTLLRRHMQALQPADTAESS